MSGLRKIIAHPAWWLVDIVLWILALLGVFVVENIKTGETFDFGFSFAFGLLVFVIIAKAVEYATRPAPSARQTGRRNSQKA